MMKRHWTLLLVGAILLLASHRSLQPVEADNGRILVPGGGQGTFGSDLDGDANIDGSYFGIGIARGEHGDDDSEEGGPAQSSAGHFVCGMWGNTHILGLPLMAVEGQGGGDRKSTRLNSSHGYNSYAVFCFKKKKSPQGATQTERPTSTCHDLRRANTYQSVTSQPPH